MGHTCRCVAYVVFSMHCIRHTKQKKIYVISTTKRPVPLQHYLYTGNSKQTQEQLFMIVNENRQFLTKGYISKYCVIMLQCLFL